MVTAAVEERMSLFHPISFVLTFLASYGWMLLGASATVLYLMHKLRPHLDRWKQEREDAEYHKDPDTVLAKMQAIQAVRDRQQQLLLEASARAQQEQREREERRKAEIAEKLKKLHENGGQRAGGDDYLPLSGGGKSTYRAPKRSACSIGGCGR